ncbi:calcineurin-like phosphoesterase family protein [Roseiarcus fermentans]|uniref:Calcineurin-like phosphoesterase family protein n=1 Tax=Roseiarcus fermentans TaxID=1473586 RepID=A0A366FE37_9HYPH|nr:metallophosphoesterase [Roseiarcus fermentans]RBP11985.1 calcineurin-like phosphoesterase family protein [Roseiarcus fermentans]
MNDLPPPDTRTPPRAILDPRRGDFENDHSAPKQRSLLAIAGSLIGEISLPKLAAIWTAQILAPAVLLGFAPLFLTGWIGEAASRLAEATGIVLAAVPITVAVATAYGWRPVLRLIEENFWSLNALAVQPGYAFWREAIRHLTERWLGGRTGPKLARMRSVACAAAGVILFVLAAGVAVLVWPATRWIGSVADLASPRHLLLPTIANTIVVMSAYLAIASLIWGVVEAFADQPLDLAPAAPPPGARVWRVAHLSDVHVVGERFGTRIESGRAGARGNGRFERALERLAAVHAADPVDLVLFTGDMTDAGTSAEWEEFLAILGRFPALAARALVLPGNHDVNIVDRANPARLDLPFSPMKALRRMRTLSAIAAVQGDRVFTSLLPARGEKVRMRGAGDEPPQPVASPVTPALSPRTASGDWVPLAEALDPSRAAIEAFADRSGFALSRRLQRLWNDAFPLILPPEGETGLGVAILDSNADTHFSFTNALGMIPADQARRLTAAFDAHPHAGWIVALHHHVTEYPRPVKAFSERIATSLINGAWFLRQLVPYAARLVVMHGHRHVDWTGACGALTVVSAPSPVMGPEGRGTHFYVQALTVGAGGRVSLLAPQRVEIEGDSGV